MSLAIGTRIGPYQVIGSLGQGGMGEVYRARDTRLNRDAAIKVLPAAFAQDADRVARFRREAQVLAALNHPNIAAIHGLEDANDTVALALEYVEGEDLAERLTTRRHPARRSAGHRPPGRGGAGSRARQGHRPSRPEAGQHQGPDRWHRQDSRLRARQGVRRRGLLVGCPNSPTITSPAGITAAGDDPRHSRLHEPGAGSWRTGGQAHRRLGAGMRDLRDVDGQTGVCRRESFRHRCRRSSRRAGLAGSSRRDAATDSSTARTLPAKGSARAPARCGGRAHRGQ